MASFAIQISKADISRTRNCACGKSLGAGYLPNEIVFGTHDRTKWPTLVEPKVVAQDAVHYFQRREELLALAHTAMIQAQETMGENYSKRRRMSLDFSREDRVWVCRQRKNLADKT